MHILHDILTKLKNEFAQSPKGRQRATWFIYTLVVIIIPFVCQNIEFVPLPSDHFRADGHDQKTILPFHGIAVDPMGQIMAETVENDP